MPGEKNMELKHNGPVQIIKLHLKDIFITPGDFSADL